MTEEIINFLQSNNYFNMIIIGCIILFNILKELISLSKKSLNNIINSNKIFLNDADISLGGKFINMCNYMIVLARVFIWSLFIIVLINLTLFI